MDPVGIFVDDSEDNEELVIDNVFEYITDLEELLLISHNLIVMIKVSLRIQWGLLWLNQTVPIWIK